MTRTTNALLCITPQQSLSKFLGYPPRLSEAAIGAAKPEGPTS